MNECIYYIDPLKGDDSNNGLAPAQPLQTYENRKFNAGDTILFKRGSVIRGGLRTCNGSELGDITYGAYGEGNKPVFSGSVSADNQEHWVEEQPFVWRFEGSFQSEVCNLIFNDGETCGNLRWEMESLKHQGEWCYTGIGQSAEADNSGIEAKHKTGVLYLYSAENPGTFYKSIECAVWGERKLVGGEHYITLKELVFQNAGVHGYQAIRADHITITDCEFRFIGGAVWNRERKIRFGNAVELWDGAEDIIVEKCIFDNIYDSGVTHQGGEQSGVPERIYFRNNLFVGCGMSAYECRGPAAQEVYFENNTCVDSGGGFSMQGEEPPRQSEIFPQPMGHHVFIWLIEKGTQLGKVYIRNNIFYEAPYGAAIYSIIDPMDEKQFVIDCNCYHQTMGSMFARMNDRLYSTSEFSLYKEETGQDAHSIVEDPLFVKAYSGDYNLKNNSPCNNMGISRRELNGK